MTHNESDWSFERLKEFWEKDQLRNIIPQVGQAFPEGFDPKPPLREIFKWSGGGSVVDLGCGYGRLCEAFEPEAYTGVDINPLAVAEARKLHPAYRFEALGSEANLPSGDFCLAYTVFLHMPDQALKPWLESIRKNFKYLLIAEILGRDWRDAAGSTPIFNREREDYAGLMKPFSPALELRVPYQRYVNSHFATMTRNTDISFLLFSENGKLENLCF